METHPWVLYSNCPKPLYLPRHFLCPPRAQTGGHHDANSIKTTTQRADLIRHWAECESAKQDHDAAIQSVRILGSYYRRKAEDVEKLRCGVGDRGQLMLGANNTRMDHS